jgi:integrase
MLFRLVRPVKRPGSSIPQFVQRIPADLISRVVGRKLAIPVGSETVHLTLSARSRSVRFSLRTRDPSEAKMRQAQAARYLEQLWQGLRASRPVALTNKQATALAGRLYRSWADGEGRERTDAIEFIPGSGWQFVSVGPEDEVAVFAAARALLDRMGGEETDVPALERIVGPLVDRLLLAEGIAEVTTESRPFLLVAFRRALRDAFAVRQRNAEGDYTPDPNAQRFPDWEAPGSPSKPQTVGPSPLGLSALLEDWWREAKATGRKPSTYRSYRDSFKALAAFLKNDDATRVTPDDLVRFKDHRLATINPRTGKPLSPKTVKDSDLAGLKTVFGWAVVNRKLPNNPAAGITLKVGKRQKLRSPGFSDTEAAALLRAASDHEGRGEQPHTRAAKRWVPWLCAYTGARVGELAQARKQDLRREGELWVLRITPEAGTVKNNEARDVVLHAHLVERGFPEFVEAAPAGHLFLKPGPDGDVLGPLRGVKNRLAEFARATVSDPNVAPNHGWRHRFKTVGLEAGIDHRVLDAIQGQAPRTVAEGYGEVTLKAMASAMAKVPRVEVA